jgi:hypothetical protein
MWNVASFQGMKIIYFSKHILEKISSFFSLSIYSFTFLNIYNEEELFEFLYERRNPMWVTICIISIIFLLSSLFIFFISREDFKKEKNRSSLVAANFILSSLLASIIAGMGFLMFLLFKGVSYVFQHVLIFESNMTIFTAGLVICIIYLLLDITVHPFLSVVSNYFYQNKAYGLAFYFVSRIAIDSILLCNVLLTIPGVELRNPYIAIFLATLLLIPDFFSSTKKMKTYEKNT